VLDLVARPPGATLQDPNGRALDRLRSLAPVIETHLADLDARGAFPAEDVALLASCGILEAFAKPTTEPTGLLNALRILGRANLSLGRIFEGHVNGALLVERYGTLRQRAALADDLAQGKLYGVWNTEPAPGVRIAGEGDAARLDGFKSYATGAGHIDRAIVTGRLPDGRRQMVIANGRDPGRADGSAWNVRGMRATVSGLYDLTGLPADTDARLGQPGDYEREPYFSAGAWRFTAVQLGGVERVLGLVRAHLVGSQAAEDPIQRARFGKAYAACRGAWLWVREAAVRAEAPGAGPDVIPTVLFARGVVESAGLEAMEAAARCVGTRAFFSDHPLDVACRDLSLYLRQPAPDQALDRAARAMLTNDAWADDPLW
jgi:alkylation response protein AidB-like acyl-CoA dehydrogenase